MVMKPTAVYPALTLLAVFIYAIAACLVIA